MELPQIGPHHSRINQLRAIVRNSAPNHRRLLVAEGLWAHEVLLDPDRSCCPRLSNNIWITE
jgi:hypothetical protein